MLRNLRIAAAVVFALLGVAFVALWVRSYYAWDHLEAPIAQRFVISVGSSDGEVWFVWREYPWHIVTLSFGSKSPPPDPLPVSYYFRGFAFDFDPFSGAVAHWFLALSSLAMAALFAFKRNLRFTVRGLLIATTVIAAMLGLVVQRTQAKSPSWGENASETPRRQAPLLSRLLPSRSRLTHMVGAAVQGTPCDQIPRAKNGQTFR